MKAVNKLELIGIYIIYIFSLIIILSLFFSYESWNWLSNFRDILFIYAILTIILTILYQIKILKSYLLISILGFLISIFGGIFVFVSNIDKFDNQNQKYESLVSELKKISHLYQNERISQENYLQSLNNLINDL
jgi:uncharacterized membrane protein YeiB